MSGLWTPGGEHHVPREGEQPGPQPGAQPGAPRPDPMGGREPTQEEMEAHMARVREELSQTPAEVVVANHAFGMFELAALHLSLSPPQLEQAQLAIDAMAALVEGLDGRLGEYEPQLKEALAQLRLAFVQIKGGAAATGEDD